MNDSVNNMFVFNNPNVANNVEPHHATVNIRGIEIDVGISDVIKFLWDHRIVTLRSCENLCGFVYIAFRNVCDAIKAGSMISTMFKLHIVPND